MLVTKALVLFAGLLLEPLPARGGNCWSGMSRAGRCTDLLQEKVSRQDCCSARSGPVAGSASTAWSEKDMDAGMLFFWRVLGGGVPCQPCRDSCAGVSCGPGRRCAIRWGRPQCVCAPDCSRHSRAAGAAQPHPRGPVCGSDGRSYRSTCRLLKRACRRKLSNLAVAYHGTCQNSCEGVSCEDGQSCVLDQNLRPHCVHCERRCPRSPSRAVCGSDGTTYPSTCHLRQAACRLGRAIPVAYRGRCHRVARCGAVHCERHQSCLTEMASGAPRCVSCSLRCPRGGSLPRGAASGGAGGARMRELISLAPAKESGGAVCGSNNRTYSSWCGMLRDACATGFVVEVQHPGPCSRPGPGDRDSRPSGAEPASDVNAVLNSLP